MFYLMYGDDSGISEDDTAEAESFQDRIILQHGSFGSMAINGEPYFSNNPEFGLASDVYDVEIHV